MRYFLPSLVVLLAAALGTQAGDDPKAKPDAAKPAPQKKVDPDKKKVEVDPDDLDVPAPEKDAKKQEDKSKEIIARLAKNMQSSEDRLGKKDPGDKTRQIQRDIVKDIDALIEQAKNQQNKGGGAAQQQPQQSQQQDPSQQQKPQNQNQDQPQDSGAECKKGECKNGGGEKAGESKGGGQGQGAAPGQAQGPGSQGGNKQEAGQVKDGGKKEARPMPASLEKGADKDAKDQGKEGLAKAGPSDKDKKDGPGGQLGKAKDDNPKTRNNLADLYRNLWGELPERRRQEMDAYQRERFMQRYDELLRQYYRTLSEQSRKRDE